MVCIYTCICTYIYIYTHVYICIYRYTYRRKSSYIYTYIHLQISLYIYTYVGMGLRVWGRTYGYGSNYGFKRHKSETFCKQNSSSESSGSEGVIIRRVANPKP